MEEALVSFAPKAHTLMHVADQAVRPRGQFRSNYHVAGSSGFGCAVALAFTVCIFLSWFLGPRVI